MCSNFSYNMNVVIHRAALLAAALTIWGCAEGQVSPEAGAVADLSPYDVTPATDVGALESPGAAEGGGCKGCPDGSICSDGGTCVCDPSNCTGCCSSDKVSCLAGTSDTLCGTSGAQCVDCTQSQGSTCSAGTCSGCTPNCKGKDCGTDGCGGTCGTCKSNQTCVSGQCQCVPDCTGKCSGASDGCGGKCPTSNCKGCCSGTVCKTGNVTSACGSAGGACADCTSAKNPCSSGTCSKQGKCTSSSLKDGTQCTGGVCRKGACCKGCWDGVTCQVGTAKAKCGKAGGACQACSDGTNPCWQGTCSAGVCKKVHSAKGTKCKDGTCSYGVCCTGCWSGNQCKGGISPTYCGKGKSACTSCSTANACQVASCSTGACKVTNRPTGNGCPGGGKCVIGTCCKGCISGSSCLSGQSASACGLGGKYCVSCGSGKQCMSGGCSYPIQTHSGCYAVQGKSCNGCVCETCVCAKDPNCCNVLWDTTCANLCRQCNTNKGCTVNPPTTASCPGCGGCACETCVCAADSYCCNTNWDSLCASACKTKCGGGCP